MLSIRKRLMNFRFCFKQRFIFYAFKIFGFRYKLSIYILIYKPIAALSNFRDFRSQFHFNYLYKLQQKISTQNTTSNTYLHTYVIHIVRKYYVNMSGSFKANKCPKLQLKHFPNSSKY